MVFIFTADYGKTCRGRGHIVSPRAQLVNNVTRVNDSFLALSTALLMDVCVDQ